MPTCPSCGHRFGQNESGVVHWEEYTANRRWTRCGVHLKTDNFKSTQKPKHVTCGRCRPAYLGVLERAAGRKAVDEWRKANGW